MEPWRQMVASLLPEHAEVMAAKKGGDLVVSGNWPLNSDPSRPKKRSKTLSIIFSHEFLEDYASQPQAHKSQIEKAALRMISDAVKSFTPDHNSPAHISPPSVEYVISSDMRIQQR